MSATTFDVHSFNRRTSDVATALLTALDVREIEKREAAVAEREAQVAMRERAIDRVERIHELKGFGASAPSAASASSEPVEDWARPAEQASRRHVFQQALRLREIEWWSKVLGVVPTLP